MAATLTVTSAPEGVRVLTVSNPSKKNALDDGVIEALDAALRDDVGVRCWLLKGDGEGVFSAGYDLTSLSSPPPEGRLPDERLGEVFDRLTHHPAPSVAVINGPAFGAGCELAVACDFRVGDARAVFCMPPTRIGVVYAHKGLDRFVQRLGVGPTRWMMLTGRRVDAAEALRLGLLDELTAQGDAEARALALCADLVAGAPLSVAGLKRGLTLLAHGGGTEAERADYEALRRASFVSDDAREGRDAVLEKRKPTFTGR